MPAPVTDAEVDAWMADAWPGRDTPLWSREQSRAYLAAEHLARERHEAKLAANQTKATPSVVALQPQQPAAGRKYPPYEVFADTLGIVIAELRKERDEALAKRDERIDQLEKKHEKELAAVRDEMVKPSGVYCSGRTYEPNSFAIWRGSLWLSLVKTCNPPGTSDWQLYTKAGDFSGKGGT
jgi:hypothetical protein